ncbi:type II secretion system F family protein [Luteipulveratus halotolerans]|uniref:Uncharacterized protein n=1 Tax=Luteipulveratus halotolerans TaxID=1631356 RepID=A0A0L6CLE7_9MICO|nr:type II secretion system F family protein [Luteipulveratus halotolerans]KNX38353.1 hypothetical protein VV01_16290 [Luteipulveratus halotolerans]
MLLLIPTVAMCVVIVAMYGFRQLKSTGLEEAELYFADGDDHIERPSRVAEVVDRLGVRFQRSLLNLYGPRRLAGLERRLDHAGRPEGLSVRDFVRRQAGFFVIGAVSAVFFALAGQLLLGGLCLLLFGCWMEFWLRSVGRKRQAAVARELPDLLDVLAVTVSAGLSLQAALQRVADAAPTALAEEVQRVLEDMRLGMSRRTAFAALRRRNTAPAIESWVTAMQQAEELGTPLSEALRDIAGEVRRARAQEVRKAAAKAAPKVSLVVTIFVVPAALLLILASFVLSQIDILKGVL